MNHILHSGRPETPPPPPGSLPSCHPQARAGQRLLAGARTPFRIQPDPHHLRERHLPDPLAPCPHGPTGGACPRPRGLSCFGVKAQSPPRRPGPRRAYSLVRAVIKGGTTGSGQGAGRAASTRLPLGGLRRAGPGSRSLGNAAPPSRDPGRPRPPAPVAVATVCPLAFLPPLAGPFMPALRLPPSLPSRDAGSACVPQPGFGCPLPG